MSNKLLHHGKSASLKKSSDRSKKISILAVSNPTTSPKSRLSDVITSQEVLIEETNKTSSRKTFISRPVANSPEFKPQSKDPNLFYPEALHPSTLRETKSQEKAEAKNRYTLQHNQQLHNGRQSDVGIWSKPITDRIINVTAPVMGITYSYKSSKFVTTTADSCVRIHDSLTGTVQQTFPKIPASKGHKFQTAMTNDGDFVVAGGDVVTLWSKHGRLLHEFGRLNFQFCKHLFLNNDGLIAVTDPDANSASIMSLDGNWFHQFGCKGSGDGEFVCPTGIILTNDGDIVVADWSNRIQVFDGLGRFRFKFGTKGRSNGELDLPYGLACDSKNNIVVADWWNNRVSAFTPGGKFIKNLLTAADGIKMPAYICIPPNGNQLILSEFGSCYVKIFYF